MEKNQEKKSQIAKEFSENNAYHQKLWLKTTFDEKLKYEILLGEFKNSIPQQYIEYIYDPFVRKNLLNMDTENQKEVLEKIEKYFAEIEEIENSKENIERKELIQKVNDPEIKKALQEKYEPITATNFMHKIQNVRKKAEEIKGNYYGSFIEYSKLIPILNQEFDKMKFVVGKENEYDSTEIRKIFETDYAKDIINEYLKDMSDKEKQEFYIEIFKNIDYINEDFILTLINCADIKNIYDLIERQEEYKDFEEYEYIEKILICNIPILKSTEEEADRLLQIKNEKLRDAIMLRTSEKGITKYIIDSKNMEDDRLLEKIRDVDNIYEILKNIDDDNIKAKIIDQKCKEIYYDDERKEVTERFIATIPKIEDKEQEIERLDSAENQEILKLFIQRTSKSAVFKFIQNNPDKVALLENFENLEECLKEIEDDKIKAKMLLYLPCDGSQKKTFYRYIQDDFCKMKITEIYDLYDEQENQQTKEIIESKIIEIDKYYANSEKIATLISEEEKTEYIASLDNNDMKLSFMKNIKSPENREKIINSLTRYVDEEIKKLDNLAQKMIIEFFNDAYNGEIPQDKKERMTIALNKNNCGYGPLDRYVNGRASYTSDTIVINEELKEYAATNIGFLVHEYAHMFSNNDFKIFPTVPDHTFEEGNADIFADLVINHYLEKYPDAELGFDLERPYQTDSSYDRENAWTRTMLYPLEKEKKDIEAICEYMLGSKEKYYELTLSKERAKELPRNENGAISGVKLFIEDIYNCHVGEYKNPNEESIYLRRNSLIDEFIQMDIETSVRDSGREAYEETVTETDLIAAKNLMKQYTRKESRGYEYE